MANWTMVQKKWMLVLHLLFSAVMLGVGVVFLVLSIAAANAKNDGVLQACYNGMHILSRTAIRGSTIGAVVTGILLSVRTHWGLFKYNWIIAKEILTLLSIALGPIGMYFWTLKAIELTSAKGLSALHDPVFTVNSGQLWSGVILQILSLAAIFVLSVFKPWGRRKQKIRQLKLA